MHKKALVIILSLVICVSGNMSVFAAGDKAIDIALNGKVIEMKAKVFEGELYLPLRAVSEELGYVVKWLGKKQGATLSAPGRSIDLNLEEIKVTANLHETYIGGGYRILNGITYLRQDFFRDVLRLQVEWDENGSKVMLKEIEENMRFEKENGEQTIKREDNMQIGAVLLNVDVDGGRGFIYEKVDDKENLHGGFAVGESFYDLGAVGGIQGFLNELTYVRTFELYGKIVIKFQGVFGSHVSNTSYFVIDRGIPVPFLSTEGIATEMDIDGDGIKEIVAEMPGTILSVDIFEWNEDCFFRASVDEGLDAESVIFNTEDGSFSAYYKGMGSEDTQAADYYYACGGMKLKKDPKDVGNILSENTTDYDKDSIYEKVIVKMTEGKQYEETAAGPFQGWNWQGKFIIQLIDYNGNVISELDLNKAFQDEDLIFTRVFLLQFDDYNNDGNTDFTVGQYGSSNGNVYRLFTLIDNKLEMLPVQTGTIFSSGGNGRYTIGLEKISKIGFLNSYYDNSKGKIIKQYFIWDGSQFVLQSSMEK